jgi:uncharacterized protein
MMTGVAMAFAGLIGVLLGALGGGGSILTVPVLVYVLAFDTKQAIAISLLLVGLTSLVGVVEHWRAGHIEARPALIFGVLAMAGAYVGAGLGARVSAPAQLTLLSIVMLAAAVSLLRARAPGPAMPLIEQPLPRGRAVRLVAVIPFAIGMLTGLVGIGGGFLFVPALVLAGVPMRHAVGTSLVVVSLNAAAGFAGYLGRVPIPWGFVGTFVAAASVGVFGGVSLVRVVPQRTLQRAFGVLLVAVAGLVFYQAGFGQLNTEGQANHDGRQTVLR